MRVKSSINGHHDHLNAVQCGMLETVLKLKWLELKCYFIYLLYSTNSAHYSIIPISQQNTYAECQDPQVLSYHQAVEDKYIENGCANFVPSHYDCKNGLERTHRGTGWLLLLTTFTSVILIAVIWQAAWWTPVCPLRRTNRCKESASPFTCNYPHLFYH